MRFPFQSSDNNSGAVPDFDRLRQQMVDEQIRARGVSDPHVLEAMGHVPREAFVPPELGARSYMDGPLPIGEDQTISQPFIVALMSEALRLAPGQRVLEIGTGSGYQAAVLAEMGLEVYTVEFIESLAAQARDILDGLGYENIRYRVGDGRKGWPEVAPFDGIIATAAPPEVPEALFDQLAVGGRMVIPVGRWDQELRVYQKNEDESRSCERLCSVRFVPMVD